MRRGSLGILRASMVETLVTYFSIYGDLHPSTVYTHKQMRDRLSRLFKQVKFRGVDAKVSDSLVGKKDMKVYTKVKIDTIDELEQAMQRVEVLLEDELTYNDKRVGSFK